MKESNTVYRIPQFKCVLNTVRFIQKKESKETKKETKKLEEVEEQQIQDTLYLVLYLKKRNRDRRTLFFFI